MPTHVLGDTAAGDDDNGGLLIDVVGPAVPRPFTTSSANLGLGSPGVGWGGKSQSLIFHTNITDKEDHEIPLPPQVYVSRSKPVSPWQLSLTRAGRLVVVVVVPQLSPVSVKRQMHESQRPATTLSARSAGPTPRSRPVRPTRVRIFGHL